MVLGLGRGYRGQGFWVRGGGGSGSGSGSGIGDLGIWGGSLQRRREGEDDMER